MAPDWYDANACTHAHCPLGCDKPQPMLGADGELYCMRCLVLHGRETRMEPCTPSVCDDERG